MGVEIERKFLLAGDGWKHTVTGDIIRQGYLSADHDRVVRIRIQNDEAFITVKKQHRRAVSERMGIFHSLCRCTADAGTPVPSPAY